MGALPMPSLDVATGEEAQTSFDLAALLRRIWSAIYRNWLLLLSILGACLLLGVAATLLATPRYRATATVQIDQEAAKILGTEDSQPVSAQDADRFLQTQVDILKSRLVAEQAANSLGLARNGDFLRAMHVRPAAGQRPRQVVAVIADNLAINLPRNSRIVEISFKSPDPATAQRLANAVASAFIVLNIKRKFDQTAYARTFLEAQLVSAKQRLEDSERAMLAYARTAGLIDASAGIGAGDTPTGAAGGAGPRSLVTSDLVTLNNAYATARAQRVAAQQHWDSIQATPLLSLPEVLANPAYNALAQARAQARAAYDQESQRHRPDFPSLQQLGVQIAGLDRQITHLATNIRESIRDQYLIAQRQETALAGNVSQLKADTLTEQDKSVRYNILKRETDTNRTMYDGLLQRYKEISAQARSSSNNVAIVDAAALPDRPFSPRATLNLLLAMLLGLALAAAAVALREKFDDAVRSPDDVPHKLGLPLLSTIPLLRAADAPRDALDDPRSPLSESYAALRTTLELAHAGGLPASLLFTSSRAGEGKSTSAYAVARDFARIGRRTLLIDGDLRRPSLHRTLGLDNARGFSSLLARQHGLTDLVQPTGQANLAFLAAGPIPPNPPELLSGDTLARHLAELRRGFDLIIIDGPPVLGLADALILAARTAATVFVVEANGAHHGAAKAAVRRLASAQAPILGAILTKFDARKSGYAYDYEAYSYQYAQTS